MKFIVFFINVVDRNQKQYNMFGSRSVHTGFIERSSLLSILQAADDVYGSRINEDDECITDLINHGDINNDGKLHIHGAWRFIIEVFNMYLQVRWNVGNVWVCFWVSFVGLNINAFYKSILQVYTFKYENKRAFESVYKFWWMCIYIYIYI